MNRGYTKKQYPELGTGVSNYGEAYMRRIIVISVVGVLISVACGSFSFLYATPLTEAYKDYLYGDYQEAIKKAEKLKENDEVLYFLGLVHLKLAERSKARIYLQRLIKRFPRSQFYEQGLIKFADTFFRDLPLCNIAENPLYNPFSPYFQNAGLDRYGSDMSVTGDYFRFQHLAFFFLKMFFKRP